MFTNPLPSQIQNSQAAEIPQHSSPKTQIEKTTSPNSGVRPSKVETFHFRPLGAQLYQGYGYETSVGTDLYCKIRLGLHSKKTSTVEGDTGNPKWFDMISLQRKHHESFARITLRDKDRMSLFENFGKAKIPLAEVVARGELTKWYPLVKKEAIVGKILMQIQYIPARAS